MSVLKVSNFMTQKVITAHPDDRIRHTFFRMREGDARHFLVVDDDDNLVGIICDRDLRCHLVPIQSSGHLEGRKAGKAAIEESYNYR